MKIVSLIARLLMGAIFVFFGANIWFHFLPAPAPTGVAAQFFGALFASHFIHVVAAFQVIPGILLLINRYVPLALALLIPVIFNIDLTHLLMAPSGLPLAGFVTLLWIIVFSRFHRVFHPIFQAKADE
jgi:putative oxidoreductase